MKRNLFAMWAHMKGNTSKNKNNDRSWNTDVS